MQGVLLSISWIILPIYFVEKGIDLSLAGLVIGIVSLPWSLKFLYGGFVDYYYNSLGRKTFVISGGILFILTLFFLAFVDPGANLLFFAIILFLSYSGIVILDVAIDAWAIEISTNDERGKVSGSMFTGQYGGRAFGSVFLGFIAFSIGYSYVFIIASIIMVPIIVFPFFIRETKQVSKSASNIGKSLLDEFKKKKTQVVTLFAFILQFSLGIIIIIIPWYYADEFGLNIAQIGLIMTLTLFVSAIGCLTSGVIADKIGKKELLYVFISVSMIFIVSLVFADSWLLFTTLYTTLVFFQSGYVTVAVALLMDITNPRVGATQYAILTSFANASLLVGNTISGVMVSFFGYHRVFLYAAVLLGPPLLVLYLIRKK
jgi:MFS family permease